jgi:hypothetical protein
VITPHLPLLALDYHAGHAHRWMSAVTDLTWLIVAGTAALVAAVALASRRRVHLRADANWIPTYDFKSKSLTYIPREKLKTGWVQARIHGIDGLVWVDPAQMKSEKVQHPPLEDGQREELRVMAERLREVHPLSLEQWEDRMRREIQPERAIARWCAIAAAYTRELEGRHFNQAQRGDVFHVVVACASVDGAGAVKGVRLDALARTTAEQIAGRCRDLAIVESPAPGA